MIKFENDIFYLSAGETCYIFRLTDGVLRHVYFGKRVEPEDDLAALGYDGKVKELTVQTVTGGKKKDLDLVFTSASVVEDGYGNSKSLVVELCDENAKLKAHLHYTPHPRGGIFRRVEIEHTDGGATELALVRQSVGCCGSAADSVDKDNNGNGFSVVYGEKYNGDAYGFLCANADGNVEINKTGDGAEVVCDILEAIAIEDFDKVTCPELLCVYSDVGKGGVSRIFHDILRGGERDGNLSERTAVLFLPKINETKIAAAVKAAGELGFGVVALDGGEHGEDMFSALCAMCRENGLNAGLRISGTVRESSVLYSRMCGKASTDEYKYDDTNKSIAALCHRALGVAGQNDIRYIMIDSSAHSARGMFELKNMLIEHFNGFVRVDFGMTSDEMSKAFSEFYPLEYVRNIVNLKSTENFKTRFDAASLGTLGYELDPTELSDGIKRAVRAQILSYQDDALTVMHGDIYRQGDICRMAVSKDKSRAYAVCDGKAANVRVKLFGLDEHNLYHVHEKNKTFSGEALVHCGIAIGAGTYVFHIRQVADY